MKGLILKSVATLSVCLLAANASAVPLLRATAADFQNDLATIYPDSQDPNLYYFLPNKGGIAFDNKGKPLFELTTWGLKEGDPKKGGGYMSFVTEAGLTDALRAELKAFQAKHPGARLTVVPFGKSSIEVGRDISSQFDQALVPDPSRPAPTTPPTPPVLGGFGMLFTDIMLPPSAGVAETQEGVNAMLTQQGARVMRAILSGSGSPDGEAGNHLWDLSLCYQVYGALPVMEANIHMDYQKIYEYFQTSASGGWGWFGWSLSAVVEKLRQNKTIDWQITGGDAKDEDYVKAIAKELADTYLKPQLSNSPGASSYTPFAAINFGFNATYKEERSTADYHMRKQVYITDDRCVDMGVSGLAPWKNGILHSAD